MIKELERVSRYKIVISTPNGFFPQKAHNSNIWQEHKSGWTVNELTKLGYRVNKGFGGLKIVRWLLRFIIGDPQRNVSKMLNFVLHALIDVSRLITQNNPMVSMNLFAVKIKA